MRTGITCKNIPCSMHDSTCRWLIVKKAKIFGFRDKHFWFFPSMRNRWVFFVYANEFSWTAQSFLASSSYFLESSRKKLKNLACRCYHFHLSLQKRKKWSNYYGYFALEKKRWDIKLGKFKCDQKYFTK